MKTLLGIALVLALLYAIIAPIPAQAKPKGDTVGAPTKEVMTEEAIKKLESVDVRTGSVDASPTRELSKKEERKKIRELMREIKRLQKLIRELTQTV